MSPGGLSSAEGCRCAFSHLCSQAGHQLLPRGKLSWISCRWSRAMLACVLLLMMRFLEKSFSFHNIPGPLKCSAWLQRSAYLYWPRTEDLGLLPVSGIGYLEKLSDPFSEGHCHSDDSLDTDNIITLIKQYFRIILHLFFFLCYSMYLIFIFLTWIKR